MSNDKNKHDKNKHNKNKHSKSDKNRIEIGPVDFFYDTKYTATTVNTIKKIYDDIKYNCICNKCTYNVVDTQIVVQDNFYPIFVIQRKNYCSSCWIKKVTLNSTHT